MKSETMLRRDFLKSCAAGALAFSSPGWKSSALQGQGRTTVAEDVGRWVAKLRYEDLPPQIIQKAKRVFLDTLGCALGAVDATPVRIAQQVVALQGGNPQGTVIGVGSKSSKISCEQAAFLNGMAIRYL